MTDDEVLRIGEVAERTSLSLRTLRHYEDVGLVPPSARTEGGFRLYSTHDVERLMIIRRMKPLGYSLDEMRALLEVVDALRHDPEDHQLRETLQLMQDEARARRERLATQVIMADEFLAQIDDI
ncbi:MerR family transcriptional regulator [Microbacterium sp. 22242]|uniref:MerR family transcriptional regulator n=1 Tax=Microbacterium sp. 22242 TaxID=3453896 RepID=UPI003F8744EC